jgi:hypothetical protein
MAAEPKRSFKRTVASTVEGRSPRFLLSSLALAMVLSILAGLGIGIKIGEHNKKKAKPVATTKPTTPTTRRANPTSTTSKQAVEGVVVRETATSLVVTSGKRQGHNGTGSTLEDRDSVGGNGV